MQTSGMIITFILCGVLGGFFSLAIATAVFDFLDPYGNEHRKKIEKTITHIVAISGAILTPLCFTVKTTWGNNTIGSIFCKNDFTAYYFVEVESYDLERAYVLPAKIHSFNDPDAGRVNKVEKVYWPNGGYLYFGDYDYMANTLPIGEEAYLTDQDGEKWFVEITNKKIR